MLYTCNLCIIIYIQLYYTDKVVHLNVLKENKEKKKKEWSSVIANTGNEEPPDESERGEWKSWLKIQHLKN